MKTNKLIEALLIMKEYGNHRIDINKGEMTIDLDPEDVTEEDREKLESFGFHLGADGQSFEL